MNENTKKTCAEKEELSHEEMKAVSGGKKIVIPPSLKVVTNELMGETEEEDPMFLNSSESNGKFTPQKHIRNWQK